MRRAHSLGFGQKPRRSNWSGYSLVLVIPATVLCLLALYTVTRTGALSRDVPLPARPDRLLQQKFYTHTEPLQSDGRDRASTGSFGSLSSHKRHSSVKLETFPMQPPPSGATLDPPGHTAYHAPVTVQSSQASALPQEGSAAGQATLLARPAKMPLVVYTLLSSDDPEHDANFQYYLREGIREDDGCTHIIILNRTLVQEAAKLPRLPSNARYLSQPSGTCYWGNLGALLKSSDVTLEAHSCFLFLNSRIRGPFVPAYLQGSGTAWPHLMAAKLDGATKLVGPTISCQGILWPESVPEGERTDDEPHVHWTMLATDLVGLQAMLKEPKMFQCHDASVPEIERYSALFASRAVLQAGYKIDCLLQRYQGVSWAAKENWGCNAGLELTGEHYYDGISIHPMEVMFVEVDGMKLRRGQSMSRVAKKYDTWKSAQTAMTADVASNFYAFDPLLFRAKGIAYMEKRGPGCFDFGFYAEHSWDIREWTLEEQWEHFVSSGQFEERPYRFNCVDIAARSFNCFDHEYYNRANEDLNKLRLEGRPLSPRDAWAHFLRVGYFEQRAYRFSDACGEDLDSPNNLGEGTR